MFAIALNIAVTSHKWWPNIGDQCDASDHSVISDRPMLVMCDVNAYGDLCNFSYQRPLIDYCDASGQEYASDHHYSNQKYL